MTSLFWPTVILALVAIVSRLLSNHPSLKGLVGEWMVHRELRRRLPASQYTVLRDVTLPSRDGTTQIDHVVVSPFGVFVIETKNFSGWIFGSERDATWTQTFRRARTQFQNPLRQNFAHVKTLEALLQLPTTAIHSVVVFTGAARFKTQLPDNVLKLGALSQFILSHTKALISPDRIPALVARIESSRFKPGWQTHADHVASLKPRYRDAKGLVNETRGLVRQFRSAFVVFKVAMGVAGIALFLFVAGHFLQGAGVAMRPLTQPTTVARPDSGIGNTKTNVRRQDENREEEHRLAWEASLLCAYSVDTERCACYEPSGPKAQVTHEQCMALANK